MLQSTTVGVDIGINRLERKKINMVRQLCLGQCRDYENDKV